MSEHWDALKAFKERQKDVWAYFAPLEALTTAPAAKLVRHAGVRAGQRLLDVACGTGVVAVTAARAGANVSGIDITPSLVEHARENARIAGLVIDFQEADAEALPFEDGGFDAVLSQFGHMFAPRPAVAVSEMLRVLKPGGVLAFSTWPPELFMGRLFALIGRYMPPPPIDMAPSPLLGDPGVIRDRLGDAVRDISFDRDRMLVPVLSPEHHRAMNERTGGQVAKLVDMLAAKDPARLDTFRTEYIALAREYFSDNIVHCDFLLTRAIKR
jgi:SAM-dependent methyltransferase